MYPETYQVIVWIAPTAEAARKRARAHHAHAHTRTKQEQTQNNRYLQNESLQCLKCFLSVPVLVLVDLWGG